MTLPWQGLHISRSSLGWLYRDKCPTSFASLWAMGCYSGRNMKYFILPAHKGEGQLHLSSLLLALMLACRLIIVLLEGGDGLDLARSIPNTRLLVGLERIASFIRLKSNNCWEGILASVPHLKVFFVFFDQTHSCHCWTFMSEELD